MEQKTSEAPEMLKMRSCKSTKTGYRLELDYCSNCWKNAEDDGILQGRCGRCGMVTYCSKECQVADWKAKHKNICNDWTTAMNPQRSMAHINILFNRNFAGVSSVFQWLSFRKYGAGVVVAELSDEPDMFLIPREQSLAEGRLRTINFSFCHTNQQIQQLSLDFMRVTHPNLPPNAFNIITSAVRTASQLAARMQSPPGQYYAMVLKHPSWMSVYLMVNWLPPTHPTLNSAIMPPLNSAIMPPTHPTPGLNSAIRTQSFDWDSEAPTNLIVSEQFYEQCMATNRARAQSKGDERSAMHPKWGGVCPPLALEVNIQRQN